MTRLEEVRGIRVTRSQLVEQRRAYSEAPARDWFDARIADCDAMIEKLLTEEVAYRADKFSDWQPEPI